MRILTIIYLFLAVGCAAQTRVGTNQIQDGAITAPKISTGAVTPEKLSSTALRPTSGGVLSNFALVFDQVHKKYTLDVDSDIALTIAGSGNVDDSRITIIATGDGAHSLTWPDSWEITGTHNPEHIQKLTLEYTDGYVFGEIKTIAVNETIEAALQSAEIPGSTLNRLNLTFDNAVDITISGWSVSASGGSTTLLLVSGSGTTTPSFTLSRSVSPGETVTISYSPSTGSTTSTTGNEIETITNQSVTVPPPVQADNCPGCTKFVDDDAADDIAAGTIGDPFKTIAAAMAAASSGDIIGVRGGTYREMIVCKANVTVREYMGEDAIISGFEVIPNTGWTVHSGNIYKKTITLPVNGFNTSTSRIAENSLNTTIFANQILRNGVMMVEARYPNISVTGTAGTDDYFDRTKYKNGVDFNNGFGATSLSDASMPNSSSLNLNGATLVCNGWFAQETRTISGHSGTTFNYSSIWDNTATGRWTRVRYYITNKLGLLDAAGEWHYESGTLYFWQPGGGTPSGTIQYKARNWGFDARGKANVKIIGLTFIGCEPFVGDVNSTDAVIDNIDVTFQNHHVRHDVGEWQGVGMSKQFGIKLLGANSVIKNSRLSYGGSTGIWLGNNCRAENNLIHDYGYVGYFAIPINLWGPDAAMPSSDNQVITRNTIYRTGRSSFEFGYNFNQAPGTIAKHFNVEVSYNDFSQACMISSDGGGTYTWGQCDLKGLNMHHNWVHDITPRQQADGGINVGFYFDQATGPGRVHHNVTWNCVDADLYHETTNDWRPTRVGVSTPWNNPDTRLDIYNNTFWTPSVSSGGGFYYSPASYRTYVSSTLDVQRNNIYRIPIVLAWQAGNNGNTSNSVLSTTNPLFTGSGTITDPQDYFQLQSGSPARNIGLTTYAGATGTISDGAVDAGAYKYNNTEDVWIPGYTAVPVDDAGELTIDNAVSASNAYTGTWNHYSNLAWNSNHISNTFSVSYDAAASLTTTFTGDHVEWWTEKRENHGIVEVRIDGVRQDCDSGTGGVQDCDLYENTQANGSELVFQKDLTQGTHTISIHPTNTNNASATGTITQAVHDAFKVTSE